MKSKKVKGRVVIKRAMPYKGHMAYVRYMKPDYFEYLVCYKGQVYSGYMIFTLPEGRKRLSKREIEEGSDMLWMGAETTIDQLLNIELDEGTKEVIDVFESGREQVEKVEKEDNARKK